MTWYGTDYWGILSKPDVYHMVKLLCCGGKPPICRCLYFSYPCPYPAVVIKHMIQP